MSFDIAKYPTLALVDSTQELRLLPKESLPRWGTPFKMIFWRLAGHFPCRILIIMIFPGANS